MPACAAAGTDFCLCEQPSDSSPPQFWRLCSAAHLVALLVQLVPPYEARRARVTEVNKSSTVAHASHIPDFVYIQPPQHSPVLFIADAINPALHQVSRYMTKLCNARGRCSQECKAFWGLGRTLKASVSAGGASVAGRQISKPMTHLWIKIQQLSVRACLNVKHLQARDEPCSSSLAHMLHADEQIGPVCSQACDFYGDRLCT